MKLFDFVTSEPRDLTGMNFYGSSVHLLYFGDIFDNVHQL